MAGKRVYFELCSDISHITYLAVNMMHLFICNPAIYNVHVQQWILDAQSSALEFNIHYKETIF